eukprot:g37130.t1
MLEATATSTSEIYTSILICLEQEKIESEMDLRRNFFSLIFLRSRIGQLPACSQRYKTDALFTICLFPKQPYSLSLLIRQINIIDKSNTSS